MEYTNIVWHPYLKQNVELLERVQHIERKDDVWVKTKEMTVTDGLERSMFVMVLSREIIAAHGDEPECKLVGELYS